MNKEQFTLNMLDNGDYEITSQSIQLTGRVQLPILCGKTLDPCTFTETSSPAPHTLAGEAGNVFQISGETGGLKIIQELFIADDGQWAATRQLLKNQGSDVVILKNMIPYRSEGDDAVVVDNAKFNDWLFVRQAKMKGDQPGSFKPSARDARFKDALVASGNVVAGGGASQTLSEEEVMASSLVQSDGVVVISSRLNEKGPKLAVSLLGQLEHLSNIDLGFEGDPPGMDYFQVCAEMDYVTLDPGESRASHWVVFNSGTDIWELMRQSLVLTQKEFGFKQPERKKPVLYCSWQFFGLEFDQNDLEENCLELKNSNIPVDGLLIDNGWMTSFGTYDTNYDRFPAGMTHAAEKMKEAGLMPGIWTCPAVISPSDPYVEKYPDLFLKDIEGNTVYYRTAEYGSRKTDNLVVDPTSPHAKEYFTDVFTKLKKKGFTLHKMDFLRATVNKDNVQFYNRKMTRAQAYRTMLTYITEALGPECYTIACGGLYEAGIGLSDAVRVTSDVFGTWRRIQQYDPDTGDITYSDGVEGHAKRIQQGLMRTFYDEIYHTDPDALMIRKRTTHYKIADTMRLCAGTYTDEEALTCVAHQVILGGISCFSEKMNEFQPERKAYYRRVMPCQSSPFRILDYDYEIAPQQYFNSFTNIDGSLGTWDMFATSNWQENDQDVSFTIAKLPITTNAEKWAVVETITGEYLGLFDGDQPITYTVPLHGTRMFKILPWKEIPTVLTTDAHLSGGVELENIKVDQESISGTVRFEWNEPFGITVLLPGETLKTASVPVSDGKGEFSLALTELAHVN